MKIAILLDDDFAAFFYFYRSIFIYLTSWRCSQGLFIQRASMQVESSMLGFLVGARWLQRENRCFNRRGKVQASFFHYTVATLNVDVLTDIHLRIIGV
jgi:hypothetical protein